MAQRSSATVLTNQILQAVHRTSLAVKVLCAILVVFYTLSFIPSVTDLLSVNPGTSYPPHFRLWSFVTAPFLETHWWNVLIDVILTAMAAQLLEPLWTSRELLIFVLLVGVSSSLLAAFLFVLLYIPLRRDSLLFVSFHGFLGVLSGYLVAFKQVMPDHSVIPSSLRAFQLKSQMLPVVVFVVSFALSLNGLTSVACTPVVGWGIVVSWVYLRFYQRRRNSDSRGDLSDTFAFATFFPEPLQPAVSALSVPLYNMLVRVKLCPKRTRTVDIAALSSVTINLPGMDKVDAERRKQKALKALDERLNQVESQPNWPSLDTDVVSPTDTEPEKSGAPVADATRNVQSSAGDSGRGGVDESKQTVEQDASSSGQ